MLKLKEKSFWTQLRQDKKEILEEIKKNYEALPRIGMEDLSFEKFKLFFTTGNRRIYENKFYARIARMRGEAVLALLYPEEEKYLTDLQNTIWQILNEYSWAPPAHIHNIEKVEHETIDLLVSILSAELSQIKYLLSDRLDEFLQRRISFEIRRRAFTPYYNNTYWWEESKGNWAAVCAGNIGIAYLLEAPEEWEEVKPRIMATLNCYLSSMGEDGVCLEGYSYWKFGFEPYVSFAIFLYEYTNGKENLFDNPHVKKIAQFENCVMLNDSQVVCFADSQERKGSLGLSLALHHFCGAPLQKKEHYIVVDTGAGPAMILSPLLWELRYDEPGIFPEETEREQSTFAKDAMWYIRRENAYALAAKAGCNAEPHNHNDVGSFQMVDGEKQILCEFGAPEYTADTFHGDRYAIFCVGSQGHNVPLIDGKTQKNGEEYRGTMRQTADGAELEIAAAYGIEELTELTRKFSCNEEGFSVADRFAFTTGEHTVTERFVTMEKPQITTDGVVIDRWILTAKDGSIPVIQTEMQKDYNSDEQTVYCIDYPVSGKEFKLTVKLR